MTWIRKRLVILLSLNLLASISWAQSVSWNPPGGTLQQGKSNLIELRFQDCEPSDNVDLPRIDGLELELRNTSSNTRIFNGVRSSEIALIYAATPSKEGEVVIPFFEVETNIGEVPVQEARFQIVEATVGDSGLSPDEIFLSRFQLRDESIYQGEVFQLDYFAGAKEEYPLADLSEPDWAPENFVVSGLQETQSGVLPWQGERYSARAYQTEIMATQSGALDLPGVKQTATIVIGRRRGLLFSDPVYDRFNIEADPVKIEILPLPSNAPSGFQGAVGEFTLESRVVPTEVQVGEPVTWTLTLSGRGNWPSGIGVPARNVSKAFRAIQPEIDNQFEEGAVFEGSQSEDIVLIPTSVGSFTFGPLAYSFFNPETERYQTIEIPAQTVTVNAISASGPLQGRPNPADHSASPSEQQAEIDLTPGGESTLRRSPSLPKEPIPGATLLPRPLGTIQIFGSHSLAILLAPLALWIAIALSRAIAMDPNKQRRQAYRSLQRMAQEDSADSNPSEQQRRWRQLVAQYWGVETQEPTPNDIARAARQHGSDANAEKWSALWKESDRILFGPGTPQAEQWRTRFAEAIADSPRPKRNLAPLRRRQAWLGGALLLLSVILSPSDGQAAADPFESYQSGAFESAQEHWVDEINRSPDAWEYRYNAGLAAAQQEKWGHAWALWAGAFCLNPQAEQLQWNLSLAHTKTPSYDETLVNLLDGNGAYSVVRVLSPAGWERTANRALWIASALFALTILSLYLSKLKFITPLLLFAGIIAALAAPFSKWAHSKYGILAQPQCVLITDTAQLRSIPTDLGDDQLNSTISPGTAAIHVKDFLGWSKVELPNGDIGWLRRESYLPLYGPLDKKSSG